MLFNPNDIHHHDRCPVCKLLFHKLLFIRLQPILFFLLLIDFRGISMTVSINSYITNIKSANISFSTLSPNLITTNISRYMIFCISYFRVFIFVFKQFLLHISLPKPDLDKCVLCVYVCICMHPRLLIVSYVHIQQHCAA